MSRKCVKKFIPWFDIKKNKWFVHFSANIITPYRTQKQFNSEEEAKQFVLDIFPNVYDFIPETERKCISCNHILPLKRFYINENVCKSCRNIERKIKRKKRRDNNICTRCNNISLKNHNLCFDHWFMEASRRHFKTIKYDTKLIDLWEKQNRRCVYSNVELIPADNMSLDHIISKYDNPDLAHDFNNVQWVHKDINNMKTKFSHDAFITLCKYISQKFS